MRHLMLVTDGIIEKLKKEEILLADNTLLLEPILNSQPLTSHILNELLKYCNCYEESKDKAMELATNLYLFHIVRKAFFINILHEYNPFIFYEFGNFVDVISQVTPLSLACKIMRLRLLHLHIFMNLIKELDDVQASLNSPYFRKLRRLKEFKEVKEMFSRLIARKYYYNDLYMFMFHKIFGDLGYYLRKIDVKVDYLNLHVLEFVEAYLRILQLLRKEFVTMPSYILRVFYEKLCSSGKLELFIGEIAKKVIQYTVEDLQYLRKLRYFRDFRTYVSLNELANSPYMKISLFYLKKAIPTLEGTRTMYSINIDVPNISHVLGRVWITRS